MMRLNMGMLFVCLASVDSVGWTQTATRPPELAAPNSPAGATVDEIVAAEMGKRQVPGLSLAIIQDGKIVKAKGYGVTEKGGKPR